MLMVRKQKLIIIISAAILFTMFTNGCGLKKEIVLTGKTMGTNWRVKAVSGYFDNGEELDDAIKKRLLEINKSMSLYDKDSEIRKLNKQPSSDRFHVSDDFMTVLEAGKRLYEETSGAWDATIRPLVNLWGFGDTKREKKVPDKSHIENRLSHVSFDSIAILDKNIISKTRPEVTLDFGSIAKGFGVDEIADVIRKMGYSDFIVEIGGEVYASGLRMDGKNWRIGINLPDKNSDFNEVYKVIIVSEKAVATSGNYRNFFEKQEKIYSHVIDPRTGRPVENGVVSASVIAESCMYADGLATALMVMGHVKGIELVNKTKNVECFIIVKEKDGSLTNYFSRHFNDEG
jgi:FAD:protein FMN transferase